MKLKILVFFWYYLNRCKLSIKIKRYTKTHSGAITIGKMWKKGYKTDDIHKALRELGIWEKK